MAQPAASLPAPRQLLTSLINRISGIPLDPEPLLQAPRFQAPTEEARPASNALSRVPEEYRHLIITLHVLFPTLVLPALDLLDRGLISRLVVGLPDPDRGDHGAAVATASVQGAQSHGRGGGESGEPLPEAQRGKYDADEPEDWAPKKLPVPLFLVRSAAQAKGGHRRNRSNGGTSVSAPAAGQVYHVRLGAWQCSCAGFAYAAFPAGAAAHGKQAVVRASAGAADPLPYESSDAKGGHPTWSFGGLSLDGTEAGPGDDNVPICKHLLACLLGDRWHAALGQYISERTVSMEEMAGHAASL